MIITKRGGINPNQIQLAQLFSVNRVLASRGFTIKSEGDGTDTLIPKTEWTPSEADLVFEIFNDKTSRKELLDFIEGKVSVPSVAISGLTNNVAFVKNRSAFSSTFEWYLGELLVKRFRAFSSSYSVIVNDICRNSDNGESGDYDVLSILGDMNLLYIESKSGSIDQCGIMKAVERSISLHCVATVVVVERLSNEILDGMLKGLKYPNLPSLSSYYELSIKGRADCVVYKWHNCYFVHATKNIEVQLQTVLRLIEYSRILITQCMIAGEGDFETMGYVLTVHKTEQNP